MPDFDFGRFHTAQEHSYATALEEIKGGCKLTHWMWFIFPQIAGLGLSGMSRLYAISGIDEARAYLEDEVLGARLAEISGVLLGLDSNDPGEVFASPDDMKLRSCMTLFSQVPGADSAYRRVLEKFFSGEPDERTLQIIASAGSEK